MPKKAIAVAALLAILAWPAVVRPQTGNGNGPPTRDVLVVNTSAQPVPVTVGVLPLPVSLAAGGSVAISGTVNANITNQPTVNLAPGGSVTVANGAGSPVPVQNVADPATHAVQFNVNIQNGGTSVAIPVPAGKRLVVQSYTVRVVVPIAEPYPGVILQTSLNGGANQAEHHLMAQPSYTTPSFHVFEGTGQITLYSDNNTIAYLNENGSTASAHLTLSGYLTSL